MSSLLAVDIPPMHVWTPGGQDGYINTPNSRSTDGFTFLKYCCIFRSYALVEHPTSWGSSNRLYPGRKRPPSARYNLIQIRIDRSRIVMIIIICKPAVLDGEWRSRPPAGHNQLPRLGPNASGPVLPKITQRPQGVMLPIRRCPLV